jgi:hypothetical protein
VYTSPPVKYMNTNYHSFTTSLSVSTIFFAHHIQWLGFNIVFSLTKYLLLSFYQSCSYLSILSEYSFYSLNQLFGINDTVIMNEEWRESVPNKYCPSTAATVANAVKRELVDKKCLVKEEVQPHSWKERMLNVYMHGTHDSVQVHI